MSKRVFSFAVLCLAFGFTSIASANVPRGYIPLQQPLRLTEHLVNHADQLLTAVNLTRANQYVMAPGLLKAVQAPWEGGGVDPYVWVRRWVPAVLLPTPVATIPVLAERKFLPPLLGPSLIQLFDAAAPKAPMMAQFYGSPGTAPAMTPDFMVGQRVMDFRMAVINFYDQMSRNTRGMPALNLFQPVMLTYFNALSAVYFYVESLRRTYLVENPFLLTCPDKDRLIRRLVRIERTAFEIQQIMYVLRLGDCFRWAPPIQMIEPVVRVIPFNITAKAEIPFVPFTYVDPAKNAPVFPSPALFAPYGVKGVDTRAERLPGVPETPTPGYDIQSWNQRFGGVEEGYVPPPPRGRGDAAPPVPVAPTPATENIPAPPTAPTGPVDY